MIARRTPVPRLDIVNVAGQNIPLNSGPITILRPLGSSSNITVRVSATDFAGLLPTMLTVTPDGGTRAVFSADINNTTVNPAEATFNVTVPLNVQVTLNAFGGNNLPTQ